MRKIHYAQSGEWGQIKVCSGRYFTTDVCHTGSVEKVTCKNCLKILNEVAVVEAKFCPNCKFELIKADFIDGKCGYCGALTGQTSEGRIES